LRVYENGENARQPNPRTKLVANAFHDSGLRRKTGQDVCSGCEGGSADSRIVDRQSSLVSEQPQSRRRIRRTAAKSRRGGQSFDQSEAAKPQPVHMRGEQARRTHHQVLINGPDLGGAWTENLKDEPVAGLKSEPVAQPGKGDETLEFVISISAAPDDAQGQIDLSRGAQPSHSA
jgi:hypothetical protein